jgi:hypothetical protein
MKYEQGARQERWKHQKTEALTHTDRRSALTTSTRPRSPGNPSRRPAGVSAKPGQTASQVSHSDGRFLSFAKSETEVSRSLPTHRQVSEADLPGAAIGDERDSASALDRTIAAVTLPTYSATPRRHRDDRRDRGRPLRGPGQGARPTGWEGRRPRQPARRHRAANVAPAGVLRRLVFSCDQSATKGSLGARSARQTTSRTSTAEKPRPRRRLPQRFHRGRFRCRATELGRLKARVCR